MLWAAQNMGLILGSGDSVLCPVGQHQGCVLCCCRFCVAGGLWGWDLQDLLETPCLAPPASPSASPWARAPSRAALLSCGLQTVLVFSVLCPTLIVFNLSFLATELIVGPLGTGAGFPEHEPAPTPGEGSSATATAHPLVTAFTFPVIMLRAKKTGIRASVLFSVPITQARKPVPLRPFLPFAHSTPILPQAQIQEHHWVPGEL